MRAIAKEVAKWKPIYLRMVISSHSENYYNILLLTLICLMSQVKY